MTREAILLHIVNHATYDRGLVGDMHHQVPASSPANDLSVFLRDNYQNCASWGQEHQRHQDAYVLRTRRRECL